MTARDYSGLSRDVLEDRLDAAEDVCALLSWTPVDHSERGKALHELWLAWQAAGGDSDQRAHPHLTDQLIAGLAERRDRTRAATLERLIGGTR